MSTVRAMLLVTTTGQAATSRRHPKSMLVLLRRSSLTRAGITFHLRRSSKPSQLTQPRMLRTHRRTTNRTTILTQHTIQQITHQQASTTPTSKLVAPMAKAMLHLAHRIRTTLSQAILATMHRRT